MFEQTFKNIDDVLWKEAGCATELDYTEQTSWILFLKYLDDLEKANEQKAELVGQEIRTHHRQAKHRWSVWAAPKKKDGSFDHDKALTGDDLIKYVDEKLFPYLKGFRTRAHSPPLIRSAAAVATGSRLNCGCTNLLPSPLVGEGWLRILDNCVATTISYIHSI